MFVKKIKPQRVGFSSLRSVHSNVRSSSHFVSRLIPNTRDQRVSKGLKRSAAISALRTGPRKTCAADRHQSYGKSTQEEIRPGAPEPLYANHSHRVDIASMALATA
jgi:hypothetical protein